MSVAAPSRPRVRPELRHLVVIAGLVLGGVVVRCVWLRGPVRYDEAFSFLNYSVLPIHGTISSYGLPNNHVLNSVLMHGTWRVLGLDLWALRLPAFVAGCAIVPAAYLAGRALYDRGAGVWAAALAVSSAPLVDFSVNGRGYTLGILFLLVALWCAALLLERPRPWPWVGFTAACALSLWSVPTMAMGLVALGVWALGNALVARRTAALVALVTGALVAGLLALLLYSPTFGQHGWDAGKQVARTAPALRDLARAVWSGWNRATPWPLQVVLGAAALAGLALHRRLGRQRLPVALGLVVALVATVVTGKGSGLFPRYWLACLPFVLLTAAAGLAWATDRLAAVVPALRDWRWAVPAATTLVLAVLLLAAGERTSEEPPQSDSDLPHYLGEEIKAGEVAADPRTFGPAVDFQLLAAGMRPTVGYTTPPMRATGHAIVVVPGAQAATATATMQALGARVGTAPPRLLRRFDYVSVWDVPVAG